MALVANEIQQQQALGMMHDIDNIINRLNNIKMSLLNSQSSLLSYGSTLDPNSTEMKTIEQRKQKLAAYEKKIDMEIQTYQNKRKMAEGMYHNSKNHYDRSVQRCYGGR